MFFHCSSVVSSQSETKNATDATNVAHLLAVSMIVVGGWLVATIVVGVVVVTSTIALVGLELAPSFIVDDDVVVVAVVVVGAALSSVVSGVDLEVGLAVGFGVGLRVVDGRQQSTSADGILPQPCAPSTARTVVPPAHAHTNTHTHKNSIDHQYHRRQQAYLQQHMLIYVYKNL
jgi:hypothetical protein